MWHSTARLLHSKRPLSRRTAQPHLLTWMLYGSLARGDGQAGECSGLSLCRVRVTTSPMPLRVGRRGLVARGGVGSSLLGLVGI